MLACVYLNPPVRVEKKSHTLYLKSAGKVVLGRTVILENTPVLFDTLNTRSAGLPGFVIGLENNGVDTPGADSADGVFPERSSILNRRNRGAKVAAVSGPAGLADPEGKVGSALDGLNGLECLHDVVKEGVRGVGHGLTLPVGKGVGHHEVGSLDGGSGAAVNKNVPGIDSADRDRGPRVAVLVLDILEEGLDVIDLVSKFLGSQVLAVKSLRTNSETADVAHRKSGKVSGESSLLSSKVGIVVGPDAKESLEAGLNEGRTHVGKSVAVRNSIDLDSGGEIGHFLKVLEVVVGALAGSVTVSLDTKIETEFAQGADGGGSGEGHDNSGSREFHCCCFCGSVVVGHKLEMNGWEETRKTKKN